MVTETACCWYKDEEKEKDIEGRRNLTLLGLHDGL
jgi:hypothetical protein